MPDFTKSDDKEVDDGSKEVENTSPKVEETPKRMKVRWNDALVLVWLSGSMIFIAYFLQDKSSEQVFGAEDEFIRNKFQEFPCSEAYLKNASELEVGCIPKTCGRLLTDAVISEAEAKHLMQFAKKGTSLAGEGAGASLLLLDTGALTKSTGFFNAYKLVKEMREMNKSELFTEEDFQVYKNVREKIHLMIALTFGIEARKLYLTHPTYFSQIKSTVAETKHQNYSGVHFDQNGTSSYHYTSVLYLNDYKKDFTGGRLYFVDGSLNLTVAPKTGRLSIFTSGPENLHGIERVESGVRYALITGFTCFKNHAIEDPSYKLTM